MKSLKELGYNSERELVNRAFESEKDREKLRQYACQLVRRLVRSGSLGAKAEGVDAGMQPFDKAFAAYRRRWRRGDKPPYKFTTYYVWWAKREIDRLIRSRRARDLPESLGE